jgi:hypothetical protein
MIEASTDTDIIATAAGMVSEIEWPVKIDVTDMLMDRVEKQLLCML